MASSSATRRPDSDAPGDAFRRYELPGASHFDAFQYMYYPVLEDLATVVILVFMPALFARSGGNALLAVGSALAGAAMFLGRVNRVYGTMQTDLPNGRYHGVVGYIYK